MQIVGAFPQGAVAGNLVRRHHGVLCLLRTLGLRIGWQHAHGDIAVGIRIGRYRHVCGQELTVQTTVRGGQLEARVAGFRIGSHHVVRRLVQVTGFLCGRVIRYGPEGVVIEEDVRVINVVAGQEVTLHLEHVLWVAEVLAQLIGDLGFRLHHIREDTFPGLENGVFLVELVEVHAAVIGIHGRLHGVADIAHPVIDQALGCAIGVEGVLGGIGKRSPLRVRQGVQGGVTIDDPLQMTINNGRVGSGIGGQPWGNLLHALAGVAVIKQLGFAAHAVRKQEVQLAVLGGIHGAVKEIANLNAALTVIGVVGAIGVVLHWVLAGGTGNGVVQIICGTSDDRAVVNAGLVYLDAQGLLGILGLALTLGLAGLGL